MYSQTVSLPRQRSAFGWTTLFEYRAIQFCQFSPANYGMLPYRGDLPMMGRPLSSYEFQGRTWGPCGWGQGWALPQTDHQRAARGSSWVWSPAPPDLQLLRIQGDYSTGSPYLNLSTWGSRTRRTTAKPAALVDPGTCKVAEQQKTELLKAF